MSASPADPVRSAGPAPAGRTLRHPTWDDLESVTDLYAAVSLARIGLPTLRAADLRVRWMEMETLDDALLVEDSDADRRLAAYADYSLEVDPWSREVALHVDGRVHPDRTGRGLATFLLREADERARTGAHHLGAGETVVRTTVDDADEHARGFFASRGFRPVRHLLELRLDLHASPPAPAWPDGVTCRTFRPGHDEQAAWQLHQTAFADVPTHLPIAFDDWLHDRVHRDPHFDPGLILIAEHAGEPVGLTVCQAGTAVAREDGWVRDLAVVRPWRRRGIGIALLRAAFAAFRLRELTGVALEVDDVTVDGAVALYRRAGMRIVRRTDVVERRLSLTPAPA